MLAYPDAGLSYDFYLRRPVRELSEVTDLAAELRAPGPTDSLVIREGADDRTGPSRRSPRTGANC